MNFGSLCTFSKVRQNVRPGVGEEGGGGAVGGPLQGSAAAVIGCAQRQRVLADQKLDNGGVAVGVSSAMKGRPPIVAGGDGQKAPLPRAELGLRDHHLNKFQWRRAGTGEHDGSDAILVLEEELVARGTVCEGLDMGDDHRTITVLH